MAGGEVMRTTRLTIVVLGVLCASPSVARSQSLAAIAAQSEARTGAAAKTYTNADVEGGPVAPAAATAAPVDTAAAKPVDKPTSKPLGGFAPEKPGPTPGTMEEYAGEGRTNLVAKPGKSASSENEPYWRQTIKSVKDRIATAEAELRLLDSRLQAANDAERERLVEARARAERNLGFLNAEYGGHVKRAQLLGVPPEWVR
jgi:hypothetical protein